MRALETEITNECIDIDCKIFYHDRNRKSMLVARLRSAGPAHIDCGDGISELAEERSLWHPGSTVRTYSVKEYNQLTACIDPFEGEINSTDFSVFKHCLNRDLG